MRVFRTFCWVCMLVIVLASIAIAPKIWSQSATGGSKLRGTIQSVDGKPMEGVTVSIRGEGETFVTSVFTNQRGVYVFPSVQKGLKYSLWAQAQGFERATADVNAGGGNGPTLRLKPLENFEKQLTGVEWMDSFPERTPAEKRAKQIFASNCTGCHDNAWVLQNRFDAAGWNKIIRIMSISSEGVMPRPNATGSATINAYQNDLVAFLTKVRGPGPRDYTLKPLPRPTGEAAQIIVSEYDIPREEAPGESYIHNGSDWSEGTPSRWEGRTIHNVAVGPDGDIYFSDDRVIDRTIGKLDPRTAKVTSYKMPGKDNVAMGTHGLWLAPDGIFWMDSLNPGRVGNTFLSFDPKTDKFKTYPKPDNIPGVGGTVGVDSKGIVWATSEGAPLKLDGAMKMDPKTGVYTNYPLIDRGFARQTTYGLTTDREDNAWYTSPNSDQVGIVDAETGKVSNIVFPPLSEASDGIEVTEQDKENYHKLAANQNAATPLHNCPRRIEADLHSDYVWVGLFCSNRIVKMNMRTKKTTEYRLPYEWMSPYGLTIDKNHMVWIDCLNTDMIVKFNPTTEKFTEYQMPTRGTDVRHLTVDDSGPTPVVWVGYNRVNKLARIQMRKASDMQ